MAVVLCRELGDIVSEITIPNNNISLGIDTISGLTNIPPGYSRLIKNLNLNSAGWLQKRTGYQVRSGGLPLKIFNVVWDSVLEFSEIIFDPTISLSSINEGPITLTNKNNGSNIYVDEFRWKVISNKELNETVSEFNYGVTNTSYAHFIRKDPTDPNINIQEVGGNLSYSRVDGVPTEILFNFDEYFESYPTDNLVLVPLELSKPEGDAVSFDPEGQDGSLPSDTSDKIFDMSLGTFNLTYDNIDTWTIFTPPSSDGDISASTSSTIVYDSSTDEVVFDFKTSDQGFNNTLILTQVYDKGANLSDYVYPESVEIQDNGDIRMTFIKDDRNIIQFINDKVIYARQTSSDSYTLATVSSDDATVVLDNIENEFQFYKTYKRNTQGIYEEVLVESIYHNKSEKKTYITANPEEVTSLLVVWAKAETPLNRIQIDGDLTQFNKGHVYGIPHEGNYISSVDYGGRIAGLINRSDVGSQELIASLGGNFYNDVEGNNSVIYQKDAYYYYDPTETGSDSLVNVQSGPTFSCEDYYLPSPIRRAIVAGDPLTNTEMYYGKRFLSESEDDALEGRGFICSYKGFNLSAEDGYIQCPKEFVSYNKITKQLVINLSSPDFNFIRSQVSVDSFYYDLFCEYDIINIKDTGLVELSGDYDVFSYDESTKILVVSLAGVSDNFSIESIPYLKMGCFTTTVISNQVTMEEGDDLDTEVFQLEGVKVSSIDKSNNIEQKVTFNNVNASRGIPRGITLASSSLDNTFYVTSVYNIVNLDTIRFNGSDIVYKIKKIQTINNDLGNPELVKITVDSDLIITDPIINRMDAFKVGRWNAILGTEETYEDFQLLDQYGYSEQQQLNMEIIKDIILVDNYANTTKKYDGDTIYQAGLPNWRPIYNVYQDFTSNNKLRVQKIQNSDIRFETFVDFDTSDITNTNFSKSVTVQSLKVELNGGVSWDSYVGREFGFLSQEVDYTTASGTSVLLPANGSDLACPVEIKQDTGSVLILESTDTIIKNLDTSNPYTLYDGNGFRWNFLFDGFSSGKLECSSITRDGESFSNFDKFVDVSYVDCRSALFFKGNLTTVPTNQITKTFVLDSVANKTFTSNDIAYVELKFIGLTLQDLKNMGVEFGDGSKGIYTFPDFGERYIGVPQTYNYMSRLYSTDAQGNKIISKNCGYQDYEINQVFDSAMAVQLKIPDELLNKRNNGEWEIELVRTKADAPDVYYFITARKLSSIDDSRFMVYDARTDQSLLQGDIDSLAGFVAQGDTLATTIEGPARALYSTTSVNRYIQANIRSQEIASLTFIPEYLDKNFSYSEINDSGTTLFNSRINNSIIKIKGQSYVTDEAIKRNIEYTIQPSMVYLNPQSSTDLSTTNDVGNVSIAPSQEAGFVKLRLDASARNTVDNIDDVVACTIHSPIMRSEESEQVTDYNENLGVLQGTHVCETYLISGSSYGIKIPFAGSLGSILASDKLFVTLHTKTVETEKESYVINVPCYPLSDSTLEGSGSASYEGQYFDKKSKKYKNSLGNYVGSEFTDVQEYLYHMQEVVDRIGQVQGPYPVLPLFTNRPATDKLNFSFHPKEDSIVGLYFEWRNGDQCVLGYKGLLVSNTVLSGDYYFSERVFPSRVILSAENYPEVFDNPFVENTTDLSIAQGSYSAIDVNADDGQEITGIQTFLSESIFSAANLDSIILVFKTTSVYALDIKTKSVSKIETSGVGCNIPNSIESTSSGITFANDDGIYIITRNLDMQYLGRPMEGIWRSEVDFSKVGEISSFNNTKRREFYISVPTISGGHYTLSYDYALNGVGQQVQPHGWTIFDGFIPSVWAKTNSNFYYGSYRGLVLEDRDTGTSKDYRDDEVGISAVLEYAPTSFGDSGTRANLAMVISHFDYSTPITGCDVSVSTDTSKEFVHCGTINIADNGNRTRSIKVRPVQSKALYFQVRWEHATIDEAFKLTGITYKASAADDELFEEADT